LSGGLVAAFAVLASAVTLLLLVLLVGVVRSAVAMEAQETRVLQQIGADPDFVRMPCVYGGALIFGLGAAACLGLLAAAQAVGNPLLAEVGEAFGGVELQLVYPAWPLVLSFVALCLLCGGAVGSLAAPAPASLARPDPSR